MENIIINLKGEDNLVISSKINKTDKKNLEKYINKTWRLVNIKFKDKKDSIEYKLFLLSLTVKYLKDTNTEIKIKDESKEFYQVQESDLERINKYIDWMKDEMLAGLNFNRTTGLTLEKVNSFLRLNSTEQKIKEKLDKIFEDQGFIK